MWDLFLSPNGDLNWLSLLLAAVCTIAILVIFDDNEPLL
ncbi:hypothetical protein PR1_10 [Providencia phage vB_PreS_PR1]|uniref:Uncharacterized protein n=1 Tax=Providencia phage vB_PreS_PR1 TaxID=1931407 RepID=A0A1S6KVC2_9CAUD|nr:hypothetical protein FDH30_gp010 [Providencia phage vB_PreS_PR1]AQT25371.1 hypothetical protein PR1_10 [Providencia phage vB_PreS_PR1]